MIRLRGKRTPSFPSHESTVPEERSKARGGKLSRYFCADGDAIETFFLAQLFLLISSVSTEQSQICVMNTGPVTQEGGTLYWQHNLTHCSIQQVC